MTQDKQHKKFGTRHKARKRAVDLLFEAEARKRNLTGLLDERVELAAQGVGAAEADVAPLNPYTLTLVRGVAADQDRVDATIGSHLKDWTLDRLPAVDRAVLRVAVWELLHAADVPPVVVVDEAVELAKSLSTDDSPAFVNGVLGQIVVVAPQIRAAAAALPADRGAPEAE